MAAVAQRAGDKIRSVAARLVENSGPNCDEIGIKIANRGSRHSSSMITEGAKVIQLTRARH